MNTKTLIALALLCLVAAERTDTVFQQFLAFKNQYNKQYKNIDEFIARFSVFEHNVNRLEITNSTVYHTVGLTKYADMTEQEFRRMYLNLKIDPTFMGTNGNDFLKTLLDGDAPDSYDWRNNGAVSPIKDQGQCGSCWAFSTIGNIEGLHAIKAGKIVTYSEQQLVDCDTVDGGCNGGLMENAFEYLKSAGGVETESDYPYTAEDDTCAFVIAKAVKDVKVVDKVVNKEMDEKEMKEFLFKNGPLAIALNAIPLQTYTSGILDLDAHACNPQELNHGVTLVGYGNEGGKDFWIVKNSWGADWGEKGYFRIARGKSTCGINAYVSSAILG
jgi:cathepsin F